MSSGSERLPAPPCAAAPGLAAALLAVALPGVVPLALAAAGVTGATGGTGAAGAAAGIAAAAGTTGAAAGAGATGAAAGAGATGTAAGAGATGGGATLLTGVADSLLLTEGILSGPFLTDAGGL